LARPHALPSRGTWAWTLLLVAAIATWIDLSRIHALQGADSFIPVLVSLQRWTPFFWGQDRFGMLVPLIAMPLQNPLANLLVQSWLMLAAALLAPFLIARWLAGPASGWFLAGTLTNALLLLIARPEAQFDWLVVQPYALSITLGTAGLLAAEHTSIAATATALVLMLLAHWVNLGVAAVLMPLVLLRGRLVLRSMPVAIAGAVGGTALVSRASTRTTTDLIPVSGWPNAWLQLLGKVFTPFHYPTLVIGIAIAAVGGAVFLWARDERRDDVRPALIAVLAAAAYGAFIGTSRWVQMNEYFPRYVYPSILLCTVAAAIVATALVRDRSTSATALTAGVLAIATGAGYGRPSLAGVRSTLDQHFGQMTPDVIANGARVIGGNYWAVWPAVFHANLTAYRQAGEHRPVYGLTFRSAETNGLWAREPGGVLAAKPGDIEVERYADRAGLVTTFTERRGMIDLFQVRLKPDATGTGTKHRDQRPTTRPTTHD
jgi:hypothetical protein